MRKFLPGRQCPARDWPVELSGRLSKGAADRIYRTILDEIEPIHFRVYHLRAQTSGRKKASLLPQILATIAALKLANNPARTIPGLKGC